MYVTSLGFEIPVFSNCKTPASFSLYIVSLNTPSITLFGPTPGYRNTCVTNINKIIESDSNVNPL